MSALFDFLRRKKPEVKKEKKHKKIEKKQVAPKKIKGEVYKILKEPHISEKTTVLSENGKYTFKVYPYVNKIQIKKAINDHYGVHVKDVNIINIKDKVRMLRGKKGVKTGHKKAVVTLRSGEKIEIMPH